MYSILTEFDVLKRPALANRDTEPHGIHRFTRAGFASTCTPKMRLIFDLHTEENNAEELDLVSLLNFLSSFIVRYHVRSKL